MFACKGGLVAIRGDNIIDSTRCVGRHTRRRNKPRASAEKGLLARYTYRCKQTGELQLDVRGVPEIDNGQIIMHGPFAEFGGCVCLLQKTISEASYNQEARRVVLKASSGTVCNMSVVEIPY